MKNKNVLLVGTVVLIVLSTLFVFRKEVVFYYELYTATNLLPDGTPLPDGYLRVRSDRNGYNVMFRDTGVSEWLYSARRVSQPAEDIDINHLDRELTKTGEGIYYISRESESVRSHAWVVDRKFILIVAGPICAAGPDSPRELIASLRKYYSGSESTYQGD